MRSEQSHGFDENSITNDEATETGRPYIMKDNCPEASEPLASSQPEIQRQAGNWSVYAYYSKSAGVMSLLFWALFTLTGAVSASYSSEMSDAPRYKLQFTNNLFSFVGAEMDRNE